MHHHAKTDSDATSLAPSSPDNTRRPVYYVQSPSRDSHDGDNKTITASFHSSPMGSPPHSSVGRHSRESSTSRFSGKVTPNDVGALDGSSNKKKMKREKRAYDVIEEEGLLDDEEREKGLPRRCYVLAFVVGFFVLFTFFALILWGASKPQKPVIGMRSITIERFSVQAGSDHSGVSTDMISTNATVRFSYRNTGTFFGVHVSSTPLALTYSDLNVGSGDLKNFYQARKGHRNVTVSVLGDTIPLYGTGAGLSTPTGTTTLPVPLKLSFTIRSRAYVLGKLVKTKFVRVIECSFVFDPKKINSPISLKKACTYN